MSGDYMKPDNITKIPVTVTVPDNVIEEVENELGRIEKRGDEEAFEDRLLDRVEIEFANVPRLEG